MTDEQIIKALELCPKKNLNGECPQCPYYESDGTCFEFLMADSLDLINRQKDELAMWQRSAELWEGDAKHLFRSRENIKAEAIKEFAERLKEKGKSQFSCCEGRVDFEEIDNLVKEMVGEE